jgi:hypothetical protein
MTALETAADRHPRRVRLVIAAALAMFATLSWRATRFESPTYDEPLHTLAGVVALQLHDYRLNTEHPLPWKLWACLPDLFGAPLALDTTDKTWLTEPAIKPMTGPIIRTAMFLDRRNDGDLLIVRARSMMLIVAVILGAVIALWSWRLAGPVAALGAVFFYAFDPNFLAHGSLVTNDVAMTLAFFAAMFATWRVGQSATIARILALAACCTLGLWVKFSALAMAPIVVLLLGLRAIAPEPWTMAGESVTSMVIRSRNVVLISLACAALAYVGLWAGYGFRFGPAPDPTVRMDVRASVAVESEGLYLAAHSGEKPTQEQVAAEPISPFMRAMVFADDHHLLPEPWIDGIMYQHAKAVERDTYLLGEDRLSGTWYYFPVAVLVKTPTGTLLALLLALAVLSASGLPRRDEARWDLLCLTVPPVLFFATVLLSPLNLGVRHVFPAYAFAFVAIGVALVRALELRPRLALGTGAALAVGLAAESLAAYPFYIPFFNVSAGGSRGGLALLGDSNLDWGQGLRLLADWQRTHDQPLVYLSYFGSDWPERYGVHAVPLSGPRTPLPPTVKPPEVVAFGASALQGITMDNATQQALRLIRLTQTPLDVLGGCMYLYRASDVLPILAARGSFPVASGTRP